MKIFCSKCNTIFELSEATEYLLKMGLMPVSHKLFCLNCDGNEVKNYFNN